MAFLMLVLWLVFICLKLTGLVTLAWWKVFLWPFVLVVLYYVFRFVIGFVIASLLVFAAIVAAAVGSLTSR